MNLKTKKGQAMVEMALMIPILLLLVLAIVEFGLIFNHQFVIQNACRESARALSLGANDDQATERIFEVAPQLEANRTTVMIIPAASNRKRGTSVTVTVTYQYQMMIPFLSQWLDGLIVLSEQTTMRVE